MAGASYGITWALCIQVYPLSLLSHDTERNLSCPSLLALRQMRVIDSLLTSLSAH